MNKRSSVLVSLFLAGVLCCLMTSCASSEEGDCCIKEASTEQSETSDITCPECGFTKTETLPTDVCQIRYTCTNCQAELTPKEGDCCVFCTHGTHKCPSMQEE